MVYLISFISKFFPLVRYIKLKIFAKKISYSLLIFLYKRFYFIHFAKYRPDPDLKFGIHHIVSNTHLPRY
jgi:hypothetical protein